MEQVGSCYDIDISIYLATFKKSYNIVTFWINDNEEYIYFLIEEKAEKNSPIDQKIIIYTNPPKSKDFLPIYVLNIREIVLYNMKEHIYLMSPNSCLFDIYQDGKMIFFIGRNLDNTIKIYEIITSNKSKKDKGSQLILNIQTDSFVSCLYKKDKNHFFSGHKNGKLYEWKITYKTDKDKSRITLIRDLMAHKESMICCINYIQKHNILLTSSFDGKLYIRKYYDFELLSVIKPQINNSFIKKIIYTNYEMIYLLIIHKDKEIKYKSIIQIYTLNGLLLESSPIKYYNNIDILKNGKILSNNIKSKNYFSLDFFGMNQKIGDLKSHSLKYLLTEKENENILIIDFIFQSKNNLLYLLCDNNVLKRRQNEDFEKLSIGNDKIPIKE